MIKNIKRYIRNKLFHITSLCRAQIKRASCEQAYSKGFLTIGRHTYGFPLIQSYAGSESRVKIGHFCSISPGVVIITGGIHPVSWVSTYPFRANWNLEGALVDGMPVSRGDIIIGSDVWIGTEAMILSGVTIGHGAVIAARSVVTRNIPPYAIVAGVPAKIRRYRFREDEIEKLLNLKWWNWNDEQIRKAIPLLSSPDITEFLKQFTNRKGSNE